MLGALKLKTLIVKHKIFARIGVIFERGIYRSYRHFVTDFQEIVTYELPRSLANIQKVDTRNWNKHRLISDK